MRQITGNKLLVRALKEEGVDTLFGYPGACTIDISDELYKYFGFLIKANDKKPKINLQWLYNKKYYKRYN